MSKQNYYRQCELVRTAGALRHVQVSYIPEGLAIVGSYVIIDAEPGNWQVTAVYKKRVSELELMKLSRRHLKQREASDI